MTDDLCPTWFDHEWGNRKFVESGKHPSMGPYDKFTVTCRRCKRTTTETIWKALFAAPHILESDKLTR